MSCSDAAVVAAAERGEEEAVLAWLEGGGRGDATYERGKASGITLLIGAAFNGQARVVELLMQHGAEINLQDSVGCTALMRAAGQGHERVVQLLIRHGAEINLQNSSFAFATCVARVDLRGDSSVPDLSGKDKSAEQDRDIPLIRQNI